MSERTRQGLAVLGAALAVGIAADVLIRLIPGRLDVALGIAALVLAGTAVVVRGIVPVPVALVPLGVPFAFLVGALIWRDSAILFALNLAGLLILAGLASPRVRGVGRRRSALGDYLHGALQLAGGAASGAAPLVFTDIDWDTLPQGGPGPRLRGAVVGLVAAAPVAAIMAGLLMDADPVFRRLMTATLTDRLDAIAEHGMVVLVWTWLAAGALRLLLLRPADGRASLASGGRFGLFEVAPVLVIVDLLFLAFVLVQFRYLFGGDEFVRGHTTMTYAEYARSGFFQLVAVATLSLPLLLVCDWALGKRDRPTLRGFRVLATVMLVLLHVMLASALWRMRLYTGEYGLTEQRLYTTAFMGWLVLVFGWFGATVLRGRRERFGFGAIAAGLFVLGTLNLVNPDGLIARTNLARTTGRAVDTAYLYSLSADALPAIQRAVPRLRWSDRCSVVTSVVERWRPELARRERWNIAFARGERHLPSYTADCPPPPAR